MAADRDPPLAPADEENALTELAYLNEAPRTLGDARLREAPTAPAAGADSPAMIGSVHYGGDTNVPDATGGAEGGGAPAAPTDAGAPQPAAPGLTVTPGNIDGPAIAAAAPAARVDGGSPEIRASSVDVTSSTLELPPDRRSGALGGREDAAPELVVDELVSTPAGAGTSAETAVRGTGEGDVTDPLVVDVAETPSLAVADATGNEDQPIALDLSAALRDTDGSERLSIVISGVPAGAVLSAGIDNGNGTWTLTPDQLDGLTITPPANSSADFTLTVTATATEADGSTASTSASLTVDVVGVADAPTLTVANASGTEDQAIALNLASALTDTDGSESLSITIAGVPAGATLSAGTNNGDGTWTLTAGQLTGLTITPPANSAADFSLTVTATATEADGDTATTVRSLNVTVAGDADAPTLTVSNASGTEDQPIALNLAAALADTDGSETLSAVTIAGVPAGATLSAGINNGDGSWTLTPGQLTGLTLTPPANFSGTIGLTVEATTVDGAAASRLTTQAISVDVASVTDGGVITVVHSATASGAEDTLISLNFVDGNGSQNISVALADTDGSEQMSIVVSGVPAGAVLNHGRNNGFTDNTNTTTSWTISAADLADLKILPPRDFNGHFDLTLSVITVERDGNSTIETCSITIGVDVSSTADAAVVTAEAAAGNEDTAIALDIDVALTNVAGADAVTGVTIAGVPAGAVLSAGTDNGDGTWTLTLAQLSGLTITPPADSDADFTLSVSALTGEGVTSATSGTATLQVTVSAVADDPTVTVGPASGTEDTAIALNIAPALADTDGSETIGFITISNVPDGAVFTVAGSPVGTNLGGGEWRFEPGDIAGLKITPPGNASGVFNLQVSVTATESANGDTATSALVNLVLTVTGDADAPTLVVNDVSGTEDQPIALNLTSALTDTDGSESLSITIAGVPVGATLSAGTNNGNGTWTLTAAQLAGLTLTPAANSSADFNLTVTARATEVDGDVATTVGTIAVTVAGDADAPNLTVSAASGTEDQAIALAIASSLVDTDGSESLAITIAGVPAGAMLSAGIDNGDGSWTLTSGQLGGLTITPPADSSDDFTLTVTSRSTEADGDSATTVRSLAVTVAFDENQDEHGAATNDSIAGTGTDETLHGGAGNDSISAGGGADTVFGGSGNDTVEGGAGNDVLIGGAGDDSLIGGAGDDLFLFDAAGGDDVVQGGQGLDTLRLEDLGEPGDWTLTLDNGDSITGSDTGHFDLSADAGGTITFADGSSITFESIERIEW